MKLYDNIIDIVCIDEWEVMIWLNVMWMCMK